LSHELQSANSPNSPNPTRINNPTEPSRIVRDRMISPQNDLRHCQSDMNLQIKIPPTWSNSSIQQCPTCNPKTPE
ncbi:MAG: hypothetical protein HC879_15675, partial [Leptolyngbyaceae cyanobacterium SL_5_9]|nr:hypothetical protein [Leptolyngbyaceae cyanobacterium SL_5_9]